MIIGRNSGWVVLGLVMLAWAPVHGQEAAEDSLPPISAVAVVDSLPPEFLILPVVNYSEKG